MKLSFEKIFIFFFLLVIAGVIILGVVNFNANKSYFESSAWVDHTNEVIKESEMTLSTLQDMGIRIYLSTGDSSALDQYHNAEKVLTPRLDRLKILTKDNLSQRVRVDSLTILAMNRLAISKKYIRLSTQKPLDNNTLQLYTREAKANMNHIRTNISDIINTEEALLTVRKAETQKNRDHFNLSVALIFTEIVLLLIGTLVSVIFYLHHRKKFEKNILLLNADLANNVAELNNANKELESFSYSVSHDLRAPLRIIDGFAKIMSEEYKNKLDEEGKRFIEAIRSNAQHMGQLIDDLLNFSRIGRRELTMHEVDMNELVKSVINTLRVLNKNDNAQIEVEPLSACRCDENLIRQVWINLLSNAFKYSRKKEQPLIMISSQETETEVIYSIKDNGVGFDMEFADKLFGVFQRLHKVSEYEGTGVGLALVSRIVTKHKGKVWAHSTLDHGSVFYFSLPKQK